MIIKKKQFLFPSTHFAQKFNISSDFLSSSLALVEHDREVFTSLVRNDRSESIVYAAVFASRATHTWIEEGAADHVPLSPRRGSVTISANSQCGDVAAPLLSSTDVSVIGFV